VHDSQNPLFPVKKYYRKSAEIYSQDEAFFLFYFVIPNQCTGISAWRSHYEWCHLSIRTTTRTYGPTYVNFCFLCSS